MSRRRRRSAPVAPDSGSWLTTYGDLVTLLLCFFVLLFAFSTIDAMKFKQVALSLQDALRGVLDGGSSLGPIDNLDDYSVEEMMMQDAYLQIDAYLEAAGLKDAVAVIHDERGLVVRFLDTVLFDRAKADLRAEALSILDKVAEVLHQVPNQVAVEGHTDNLPIHTQEFPSNWWLSTARANRVVEYFVHKHNIRPERLSAVGYSEYRPIKPNDSEANRAQNRRVEIVIKKSTVGALEPR
ncbi:MAG: OmpA family protein [Firmicutes bacterium]|nr:OmpA family protein [Bacillota bacterium]